MQKIVAMIALSTCLTIGHAPTSSAGDRQPLLGSVRVNGVEPNRQVATQVSQKRTIPVYTMLKYRYMLNHENREEGPFHCKKTIVLDYIPQIGMQMTLEGIYMPLKVAAVVAEDEAFEATLAKRVLINFDTRAEDPIDNAEDWKVSRPDEDSSKMDEEFWDEWAE